MVSGRMPCTTWAAPLILPTRVSIVTVSPLLMPSSLAVATLICT